MLTTIPDEWVDDVYSSGINFLSKILTEFGLERVISSTSLRWDEVNKSVDFLFVHNNLFDVECDSIISYHPDVADGLNWSINPKSYFTVNRVVTEWSKDSSRVVHFNKNRMFISADKLVDFFNDLMLSAGDQLQMAGKTATKRNAGLVLQLEFTRFLFNISDMDSVVGDPLDESLWGFFDLSLTPDEVLIVTSFTKFDVNKSKEVLLLPSDQVGMVLDSNGRLFHVNDIANFLAWDNGLHFRLEGYLPPNQNQQL